MFHSGYTVFAVEVIIYATQINWEGGGQNCSSSQFYRNFGTVPKIGVNYDWLIFNFINKLIANKLAIKDINMEYV